MKKAHVPAALLRPMLVVVLMAFAEAAAAGPCANWVAQAVSVEGQVAIQRPGGEIWAPVGLDDTICPGDVLRVGRNSRAALRLTNDAVLRVDQDTTLSFPPSVAAKTHVIQLVEGAAHFFSRLPRTLKVLTPFVNGTVEGTEFLVRVDASQTAITLMEGRLQVANAAGALLLAPGESATARGNAAPERALVARPRDAVHWALYYPPTLYWPSLVGQAGPGAARVMRAAGEAYRQGDAAGALERLETVPAGQRGAAFYTGRGALALSVGRVPEALADLEQALALDPAASDALALKAVVHAVQGKAADALARAEEALRHGPQSATARIALAHARQAGFDLAGSRESLEQAVLLEPDNAIAWSRLAEIRMAVGELEGAEGAARRAVEIDAGLARSWTVLGYARLTRMRIPQAEESFREAIRRDSADPMARLGLGLALIRGGDLAAGRRELESAAGLDPNNALVRSYLGKAYFDERRDSLARDQLRVAKELDPQDPTPYFYDAIRKLTVNRPVEALEDLQQSIERNDHRAVYRSRLMLDQDLAARSASLGSIYTTLGFDQRGLLEGWRSVAADPSNYSAHRFLADTYAALPRHDIARVSELLQSQMLQPLNITPVQPALAESNLFLLEGAGPSEAGFNEYHPLLLRNRLALQAGALAGDNDTFGSEVSQAGVWNNFSYSAGYYHYETDGFRENHDQRQELYNAFLQTALSPEDSLQFEYRYLDQEQGDLRLLFDPAAYAAGLRQDRQSETIRLGWRHAFSPRADLLLSHIYREEQFDALLEEGPVRVDLDTPTRGYQAEAQQILRLERATFLAGAGYFDADRETTTVSEIALLPPPFPPLVFASLAETDLSHGNAYLYTHLRGPSGVIWTLGASGDWFDGALDKRDQLNPKVGLTWNLESGTTLRAAAFRALKRSLIADQTLEPTQVAGFNQFFDDPDGTDAWRYGLGVDQQLSATLFTGLEWSRRDLDHIAYQDVDVVTGATSVREVDWREEIWRAYLYWAPHPRWALKAEFLREEFERGEDFTGSELTAELDTYRFPLGIQYFHPSGLTTGLTATYVDQEGLFGDPAAAPLESGDDRFWVLDAALGYRLPQRLGMVALEVRNLLDEDFRFQDSDPTEPSVAPERQVIARVTLSF